MDAESRGLTSIVDVAAMPERADRAESPAPAVQVSVLWVQDLDRERGREDRRGQS